MGAGYVERVFAASMNRQSFLSIDCFHREIEGDGTVGQEHRPATFFAVDPHHNFGLALLQFHRLAKRDMLRCNLRQAMTLVPCNQKEFNIR